VRRRFLAFGGPLIFKKTDSRGDTVWVFVRFMHAGGLQARYSEVNLLYPSSVSQPMANLPVECPAADKSLSDLEKAVGERPRHSRTKRLISGILVSKKTESAESSYRALFRSAGHQESLRYDELRGFYSHFTAARKKKAP